MVNDIPNDISSTKIRSATSCPDVVCVCVCVCRDSQSGTLTSEIISVRYFGDSSGVMVIEVY